MKIVSVYGWPHSGKTCTIEEILKEMKKRRYQPCSAKDIALQGFTIDQEGKTTWRHRQAGAKTIAARGPEETDIIFTQHLSFEELVHFFVGDFLMLEGFQEANVAKILCVENPEQIAEMISPSVFCICGKVSNELKEYQGIPVINALKEPDRLVDLIEKRAFVKLPDLGCCRDCGLGCEKMAAKIAAGQASREDCQVSQSRVRFILGDKEIPLKKFVQNAISRTTLGLLSTLRGYKKGVKITLEIEELGDG